MTGNIYHKITWLIIVFLLTSCAARKMAVQKTAESGQLGTKERSAILADLLQGQVYYTTFSGKAKASVLINTDAYDATLNIRIERDKAIWISVTAILGIEAARIRITPDSILMVNRLQQTFISKPFSYLYRFTGESVSFNNLQQLITGNVLSQALTPGTEISSSTPGYLLTGKSGELFFKLQTNEQHRIHTVSLQTADGMQQLETDYNNYTLFAGQSFPRQISLRVRAVNLDLQTSLEYDRITCDEAVEMPFSIPAKYHEIE